MKGRRIVTWTDQAGLECEKRYRREKKRLYWRQVARKLIMPYNTRRWKYLMETGRIDEVNEEFGGTAGA